LTSFGTRTDEHSLIPRRLHLGHHHRYERFRHMSESRFLPDEELVNELQKLNIKNPGNLVSRVGRTEEFHRSVEHFKHAVEVAKEAQAEITKLRHSAVADAVPSGSDDSDPEEADFPTPELQAGNEKLTQARMEAEEAEEEIKKNSVQFALVLADTPSSASSQPQTS
jgi:hypothetical protein